MMTTRQSPKGGVPPQKQMTSKRPTNKNTGTIDSPNQQAEQSPEVSGQAPNINKRSPKAGAMSSGRSQPKTD